MASSASLSVPSSPRSQLQASLTQALTNKSVAQSHLYTAQASFRTADAASVVASSRLLDFKAGPAVPEKGQSPDPSSSWLESDGSEGTMEEQSGLFLVLVRGQRNAQRAFKVARDRVVGAQEVFAGASGRTHSYRMRRHCVTGVVWAPPWPEIVPVDCKAQRRLNPVRKSLAIYS